MKNTEIKYNTSIDYEDLYQILKNDILIVGFVAIQIDGIPDFEYSKIVQISYNSKLKSFDMGFTFFESDFNKDGFLKLCKECNLRFIPLN